MTETATPPSRARQYGMRVVAAVAIVAAAVLVYRQLSTVSAAEAARNRTYVDATTGKPYTVRLSAGMPVPAPAPSGGPTGYPADYCYWNADGTPRSEPFPLVLNSQLNRPGPTFCPDCGRLVVAGETAPAAGDKPPPKAGAEYQAYMDDLRRRGLVVNPD